MALIVHVASYGNPQPGSFIPAVLRLSEALRARGDEFVFITSEIPNATWISDVRSSVSQLYFVSNSAEVRAILARIRPAIVHTHFYEFDIPVTSSVAFSTARIFWHAHSMRDESGLATALKFYMKYHGIGSRVEAFVGISEAVGRDLLDRGAPTNKVKVVLNGIDMDWFRPPTPSERHSVREEFGLNGEQALLLFGRDIHIKGVDIFCNALRFLDRPTVILVGAPVQAQDEISLMAGRLISISSVQDVRKLYWVADQLIFPSRTEGLGLVLVEALACGLPAVVSDLEATREVTEGLDAICLVPAGDAIALADGIKRAQRERLDRTAQMQRFSLERWTSDILALYDRRQPKLSTLPITG